MFLRGSAVDVEERVELLARRCALKTIEPALDQRLSAAHEARPGRAGERAADTHAAHAELRDIVEAEPILDGEERLGGIARRGVSSASSFPRSYTSPVPRSLITLKF